MALNPVTNFREKRKAFLKRQLEIENLLYGVNPVTGALRTEAERLRAEAQTVQKRLDTVESMIRSAEKTLGVKEGSGLGRLGVVPVLAVPAVIITAIAGAVYLVGKFLDKSAEFLNRSKYISARTAEGVTVEQASREFSAQNPQSGGLFGDAAKLVWPLAFVVAGLYLTSQNNSRRR